MLIKTQDSKRVREMYLFIFQTSMFATVFVARYEYLNSQG